MDSTDAAGERTRKKRGVRWGEVGRGRCPLVFTFGLSWSVVGGPRAGRCRPVSKSRRG